MRQFKLHRDVSSEIHNYVLSAELAVLKGQAVMRALNQLYENENFSPDVVVCHGGMGFGLFVKVYMPNVRLISYVEWFFTIENSVHLFAKPSLNDNCRIQSRNIPLLQEFVRQMRLFVQQNGNEVNFVFIRDRIESFLMV